MSSLAHFWHAFIVKPLWVLAAVQFCLLAAGAALGYYGLIQRELVRVEVTRQRIAAIRAETAQIAQRLKAAPPLTTLQRTLTAAEPVLMTHGNDGVAALLAMPLQASGATLIALQPQGELLSVSAGSMQTASAASPARWILSVSANYHDALTLLHQVMAASPPLHIHSLTISARRTVLQVEMALSFPQLHEEHAQ